LGKNSYLVKKDLTNNGHAAELPLTFECLFTTDPDPGKLESSDV